MRDSQDDVRSRREFLRAAAALAATAPVAGFHTSPIATAAPRSPNERLHAGVIGPAGRGRANLDAIAAAGVAIVAMADIDATRLAGAAKTYTKAKTYEDFRRVLDHKNLDILVVSTPDHMHAIPVAEGLRRGLHVYCEKPLAHSVHEVRVMRELAAKHKVVTQMGTQIHAGPNYQHVVDAIQAGTIGPVRRVHVWLGGQVKEGQRVTDAKVPAGINYDLWLGPAPYRPFHTSHFHFDWRYWWDFGGGLLADFGCHFMDLPYWALGLRYPEKVRAKGEKAHGGDNEVPGNMQVDYHFPAQGEQPALHMTWYHGAWKPAGAENYNLGSAVLFEGEKGRLLANYTSRQVFLQDGKGAEPIVEPIGDSRRHQRQFVEAVKTGGTTPCNFDYSGALAETALLGNVAYRVGNNMTLEWDSKQLKATNCPEADRFIRREYRKGWTL